jgi:mannosyltransferase OCH1-like enzyme
MKSDLFRLAYLYYFGGIYADADDYCRVPIDSFINANVDLVLIEESSGVIANNFLAAVPNHPFIKFALERVTKNITEKSGGIWFASGPGALTLCFCQMYLEYLEKKQLPVNIALKERSSFFQYVQVGLPLKYKTTKAGWASKSGLASPIYKKSETYLIQLK